MVFHTNPNIKQLEEIKAWLIEEDKIDRSGFYCNWNIIKQSFDKKLLLTFEKENKIIGFATWNNFGEYVAIDIMEIHPDFRNKGFGKSFYTEVETFFKTKKIIAIKLFCSPENSESFWQKMEFIKFPNRGYSDPELTYYKPLIKIEKLTNSVTDNKLELWNLEPYEIGNNDPKWTWEINKNHKPILQPCNPNWNLRLTLNGKIIKEDKVKYFSKSKEIYKGPFLFIDTSE